MILSKKAQNEFDQNPGKLFYVVAMADKRVAPKEFDK